MIVDLPPYLWFLVLIMLVRGIIDTGKQLYYGVGYILKTKPMIEDKIWDAINNKEVENDKENKTRRTRVREDKV